MNTLSTLDRESFQEVLANAFAVQKSQMDTQSLSGIVEVQRSITSSDLDVDAAMRLIADRTRNVANATGVAIGLITGDQLVYRAGSGSAAAYTGRQVIATLSVPPNTETRQEILRVENAQSDKRMEAAICRQFGAMSLLILLVYHNHAVAGVLEIFFDKAHVFQDREVRIYRLMAGLVGEALSRAARDGQEKALPAELSTVTQVIEQTALKTKKVPSHGRSAEESPNKHAIIQACGADRAAWKPAPEQPAGAATINGTQQETGGPLVKPRWTATVAAVVTVLVIACWIAYSSNLPRIASDRLRRGLSTVPAERRVSAMPTSNERLGDGRLGRDTPPFAPTNDSLSANNREAIPSPTQGDQSQRSLENTQPATVQPSVGQASQSQEAIQHDGNVASGRAAAEAEPEPPKPQKPSPILSYRNAGQSVRAAVRRTGNGIHASAKMGRKNGTAKVRNIRAPVASIHRTTKVRTAEVKRGPARESAARMGPRSRMIAKNPKQASGPAAPERKMAEVGSKIGNLPPHRQPGNVPEPSSPAEQLNELPNKGRPAVIGQSGWHYFGDVGRGRDRSASVVAQPQNRGFGPGNVARPESRAPTTNTFSRRDASSNHSEGWHRFTPQRRWTPPDESLRKRRSVEPDYSNNGSRAASQPSGG